MRWKIMMQTFTKGELVLTYAEVAETWEDVKNFYVDCSKSCEVLTAKEEIATDKFVITVENIE